MLTDSMSAKQLFSKRVDETRSSYCLFTKKLFLYEYSYSTIYCNCCAYIKFQIKHTTPISLKTQISSHIKSKRSYKSNCFILTSCIVLKWLAIIFSRKKEKATISSSSNRGFIAFSSLIILSSFCNQQNILD